MVFRPLFCWLIASALLLGWRYHKAREREATVVFRVRLEGRESIPFVRAELNGRTFESGSHSGLGKKVITVRADDAEPFATNFFVPYGGKDLGLLRLARSRGMVELECKPTAKLRISGTETNQKFSSLTREKVSLPTGPYQVRAEFERFSLERTVDVEAHRISRVVFDPGITMLKLSSQPTNAEFELTSVSPAGVTVRSNTPTLITELPSGEYHLRIWRGDYQKTVPLTLRANRPTNELQIEFDYGQLSIQSEPPGATIRDGEKVLGTTPAALTLPTGFHQLSLQREGYFPTNFSVTLSAKEERGVETRLLSRAYVEAMEQAHQYLSAFSVDYDRAMEAVERALRAKPNDATALAWKRNITVQRHLREARGFQQDRNLTRAMAEVEAALQLNATNGTALALKRDLEREQQTAAQAEAEARRALPGKIFEQTVSRLRYHELFETQKMQSKGELGVLRARIVQSLQRKPEWTVHRNDIADPNVIVITAEMRSFATRQNVVVVLGQTAEDEVTIHFKLWSYSLGNNIQVGISGISDESYRPVHSSFVTADKVTSVERRRERDLADFKKRIEAELR